MYKDPSTLVLTQSVYVKDQCAAENLFFSTKINMSAKATDSSVHNTIKYENALFSISESAISLFNCTPEVKPNEYYSVMCHSLQFLNS